jgi:hypothetical protein
MEEIAWVATSKEIDMEDIYNFYIRTRTMKSSLFKLLPVRQVVGSAFSVITAAKHLYDRIDSRNTEDIPYVAIKYSIALLQSLCGEQLKCPEYRTWDESFKVAKELKSKIGVKRFLNLASQLSYEEIRRMVE